jgi:8-oxo-dGTP pyrophosphatase MutT (NUDIX family)
MKKLILAGILIFNEKKEILLLKKKKWQHWETPGGKVEEKDYSNPKKPGVKDYEKAALRETFEELGDEIVLEEPKYLGKFEFTIPDGKKAIVHQFKSKILSGEAKLNEPEKFEDLKYIPINELGNENYLASPNLKENNLYLKKLR